MQMGRMVLSVVAVGFSFACSDGGSGGTTASSSSSGGASSSSSGCVASSGSSSMSGMGGCPVASSSGTIINPGSSSSFNSSSLGASSSVGNSSSTGAGGTLSAVLLNLQFIMEGLGSNEGMGVRGEVVVRRGDQPVRDATVQINGVALPLVEDLLMGSYSADNITLPKASGQMLRLTVEVGGTTHDLDFTCPALVDFTAPMAGAMFVENDMFTVSWSGSINYDTIGIHPVVGFRRRHLGDNVVGPFAAEPHVVNLDGTETSATLAAFAPEPPQDENETFIELQYPGDTASEATADATLVATCSFVRRRDVTVTLP